MEMFAHWLLVISASLLAVPVAIFFCEVIAAITLKPVNLADLNSYHRRGRIAVLVPAHNESAAMLPTLQDIKAQLTPGDRMLVVADNCTDDTAIVAASAGAEVVSRNEPKKIGKGYALQWGLRHLSDDPPDYMIVVDADCRLADGAIDRLTATAVRTGRPVQALYLMNAPDKSPINFQVAEFAWRVRNWVRPLGLAALGLPCQLMGTGMAFPWAVIRSIDLASGQIVEDLDLGLRLALARSPPIFCPAAQVKSQFPISARANDQQRQRWEHGHLEIILTRVPSLFMSAITHRNLGLLALTLDVAVPPLNLLGLLTIGIFLLASYDVCLRGTLAPLIIGFGNVALFTTAVALSWIFFGRDILPPGAFWSIRPYSLQKFGLYRNFLSRRRVSRWTRTDRK